MDTPNSFYIVMSIAASILALSVYQLLGIVNIGPNVLFCFSISALLFSLNSFLDNFSLRSDKSNKRFHTIKLGIQITAVVFMICAPYIIKAQDFANINNFISLLSLALIILSVALGDLKKYDSEKRINNVFRTNFVNQIKKEFAPGKNETVNNSNEINSSDSK